MFFEYDWWCIKFTKHDLKNIKQNAVCQYISVYIFYHEIEFYSYPQGKGILKRRIFVRNDGSPQQSTTAAVKPFQDGVCCLANACKRYVTFDETIMVKNDKDLVVKKPLKLELVIDNWKSNGAKMPPETIQPNPGIVRRLVDEFNTIEEVSYWNIIKYM